MLVLILEEDWDGMGREMRGGDFRELRGIGRWRDVGGEGW